MLTNSHELPAIPAKRYFTEEEVCYLSGIKPQALKRFEQLMNGGQLKLTRRRFYQRQELLKLRQLSSQLQGESFSSGCVDGETPPMTAKEVRTALQDIVMTLDARIGKFK